MVLQRKQIFGSKNPKLVKRINNLGRGTMLENLRNGGRDLLGGLLVSASLLVLLSTQAAAQNVEDAAVKDVEQESKADNSDEELFEIENLVVTAQKREQTLQDVPVAVSVVTPDTIRKAEILDLIDLQSVVPSLRVQQAASTGRTTFSIRGFGSNGSTVGIEPSVGVYVDGVFRSRAQSSLGDLPNLERVEVLRGPQSTLFGKTALVGVVSVVTKEAQFEHQGFVEGGLTNFDGYRAKAYYTGGLTDNIAVAFGGSFNRRDGYAMERTTGEFFNDRNRYAFNGEVLYHTKDRLKIRLLGDYDRIDEVCCAGDTIVFGPTTTVINALGGALDITSTFPRNTSQDISPVNVIENFGFSLQTDYKFNFATLTSITAYRDSDNDFRTDADGTAAPILGTNNRREQFEAFTQEVRLTSTTGEFVDWVVGGFFFTEDVAINAELLYGSAFRDFADLSSGGAFTGSEALLGVPSGTFGGEGQGLVESYGQENRNFSIFGTADIYPIDKLSITLGLSYTNDRKEAFNSTVSTDVFAGLDLAAINPALVPLSAFQSFPPVQTLPNEIEDGIVNDDQLSYTARVAYTFTDFLNGYFSYATGFKASSFNFAFGSGPLPEDFAALQEAGFAVVNLTPGSRLADPETSRVFEFGLKASFDRLGVNLAVFDQKLEDFQTSAIVPNTGIAAFTNAEQQSTLGLEIDVNWRPIDDLSFIFGGTFLDPEYDEFTNSVAGDISGIRPAGISRVLLSLAGSYDFRVFSQDAFIRADWQYEGPADYSDIPEVQELIGFRREINLFNVSAGIDLPWQTTLSLFARNLFNEDYVVSTSPALGQPGTITGIANTPRIWGATARKTF